MRIRVYSILFFSVASLSLRAEIIHNGQKHTPVDPSAPRTGFRSELGADRSNATGLLIPGSGLHAPEPIINEQVIAEYTRTGFPRERERERNQLFPIHKQAMVEMLNALIPPSRTTLTLAPSMLFERLGLPLEGPLGEYLGRAQPQYTVPLYLLVNRTKNDVLRSDSIDELNQPKGILAILVLNKIVIDLYNTKKSFKPEDLRTLGEKLKKDQKVLEQTAFAMFAAGKNDALSMELLAELNRYTAGLYNERVLQMVRGLMRSDENIAPAQIPQLMASVREGLRS